MSKVGAEGIPNPSADVAARKAARIASADNLATVPYGNAGVTLKVTVGAVADANLPLSVFYVTENDVTNELENVAAFKSLFGTTDLSLVRQLIKAQGFKGKTRSTIVLPVPGSEKRVLLVGLGNVVDGSTDSSATTYLTMNGLRNIAHATITAIKSAKATGAAVYFPANVPVSTADPDGSGVGVKPYKKASNENEKKAEPVVVPKLETPASSDAIADAVVRHLVLANHVFDKYLLPSTSEEINFKIQDGVQLVVSANEVDAFAAKAKYSVAIAESVIFSREFANDRADVVTPEYMENLARSLAEAHPDVLKFRVLQYDELIAQGFNLITAVGQAAVVPPRLVALEYNGVGEDADKYEWLAYVGKGITYDTGGLNLKPTGFMEDMHMDMGGSAAVLGALRGIVHTRPKVKLVVVLALAENAIDAKSYKPHAIIDTYVGSVQVGNTDAEGRLALADALTFVQNEYKPSNIVNVATLTGACVVALGEYAAGLFSNSNEFASQLSASGNRQNERMWRLPIFPEHIDELKGDQADFNSTGRGRFGGACTAAAFLEKYIQPGVAWSHMDIAGPGMSSAPRGTTPKGATAFGVQSLVELAETFAKQG